MAYFMMTGLRLKTISSSLQFRCGGRLLDLENAPAVSPGSQRLGTARWQPSSTVLLDNEEAV